jgi:hypothetical protein
MVEAYAQGPMESGDSLILPLLLVQPLLLSSILFAILSLLLALAPFVGLVPHATHHCVAIIVA